MEPIAFWKMNGSGNDFIIIDNRDHAVADEEMPLLVERCCRRRESVGADGVIFVTESDRYDFAWRFYNADGGEAEMCGNGGRCVSRFAYLKGFAGPQMTFGTLAGPVSATVDGRMVKVLMPRPSGLSLDVDMKSLPGWLSADFINTGVPHVVIRVESLQNHPVVEEGRAIRYHDRFVPEGTNANFVAITGPDSLEIRTYERGVEDETLACGTGSIAAALVACTRNLVTSPTRVKTRSGEVLTISFEKNGETIEKVWMEGNTTIVYQGTLHEEAL
jgi:diaminopimelate epimerase